MSDIIANIRETLSIESSAIAQQISLIGEDFVNAVSIIIQSKGKLVVTGIGKSGIIGRKISATMSSTGTQSFFLHPAEAFHGDLGMVGPEDVILVLSNSGETDEVLKIIPYFKDNGNKILSITRNNESTLARYSDVHLTMNIEKEACPLNLAPTTSTTVTLALGDALSIALMKERNFNSEEYARFHPGGSLGKRLLTRVKDVMKTDSLPLVSLDTKIGDVLYVVSKGRLGIAIVTENKKIAGIITDGDIRRAIQQHGKEMFELKAEEIMSFSPKVISSEQKIYEAQELLRQYKIHSLLVVNAETELLGVVDVFHMDM